MLRIALCLGLLVLPAATLPAVGCGSGGGSPTVTRQYVGTQSPGDLWTWSILTSGDFTASNDTLGYSYAGTWVTLPSGFLQLTVVTTTDPGAMPGDRAFALEVPDSVLVIKPDGEDSNLILAARVGTCPTGPALSVNWVEMTDSAWDPLTDTAYGNAAITIAGSAWSVVSDRFLLDGTPNGPETIPGLSCAGGLITDVATPGQVIVMSPSGVFVTDNGPGGGGVMGMSTPTADVDLVDLVAPGREYRAALYKDDSLTDDDSRPVWARPNGTGGLTGGDYVDVVANVEATTDLATIVFTAQASPGVVNGTLTDTSGSNAIVFMINRIAGRYVLFGVSVNTSDTLPYNFVAIEQP